MGQCPLGPNASAAPAPGLTEDLVEEILLRFPPSEPASFVRAALVCKQWCRLISEPRFRRRFRELHFHRRTPPPVMLGFFCSIRARDGGSDEEKKPSRFVPTSTFWSPRAAADLRHCRAIAAHHGRVLLQLQCPGNSPSTTETTVLVVWDPISDKTWELPAPTGWGQQQEHESRWRYGWNAAVLCAADGHGPCDHLDCPFVVVMVDSGYNVRHLFTSTYSSDSGIWIDRIFRVNYPFDYVRLSSLPCAHVGNALYFGSENSDTAVKYDLCLQQTSLISIPALDELVMFPYVLPYVLTATEDGRRLRYTGLHGSKLYMWLRDDDVPNVDGRRTRWTKDRVIDLKLLLLRNGIWDSPRIVGFADGAGVVFFTADDLHFTVDLNTRKVKKVSKDITVDKALPYMSFYTPALGASYRGEGPSEADSNE